MPPRAYADQWDTEGLQEEIEKHFNLQLPIKEWAAEDGIANEEILERVPQRLRRITQTRHKEAEHGILA